MEEDRGCNLMKLLKPIYISARFENDMKKLKEIQEKAQRRVGGIFIIGNDIGNEGDVSLVDILKVYAHEKDVDKIAAVHAEILKRGLLQKSLHVGSVLISSYMKCGEIARAEEVFDCIRFKDAISWNTILTGYSQHGRGMDALSCMGRMQCEALSPTPVTFVCVLKASGSLGAVFKGKEMHVKIIIEGLQESNVLVGSALVDMYMKYGELAEAQTVFDELPVRDAATWNTMIGGYAQHEYGEEALNCFQAMQGQGFFPNAVTYVCILKACGSIGAVDKGKKMHSKIATESSLNTNVLVGTALVDMYGRCGALKDAQEAFDELGSFDVVSWNALVAAYVQHGYNELAVNCCRQIYLEGLLPTAVTLVCNLKACGSMSAMERGKQIHACIVNEGLLEREVGNALVDMYAKCGALVKAHEAFHRLQHQDVVAWTSLIAGYVQYAQCEKALDCFEQMQHEGVSPNAITFVPVLRACGSLGAADKGEELYCQIVKEGLFDISVANALLDMYAKCAILSKALQVFEGLPVQDIVSWNTIILLYVDNGYGEEAIDCFIGMQLHGLCPDCFTFVSVLRACGVVGDLDRGNDIHKMIEKERYLGSDIFVGTALIDMYAKCDAIEKAHEVFAQGINRDSASSNAMIAGYVQHGHNEEALKISERIFCESICPNTVTFVCMLKACGDLTRIKNGKELHARIREEAFFQGDVCVGNALVDMYLKWADLGKAQKVFSELPVRNVVSWNVVISGHVECEHDEEALDYFAQMLHEGLIPDEFTLLYALKACSNLGAIEKGCEMHAAIQRDGLLERDVLFGNAVLAMYSKCGSPAKAQEVFDRLKIRDAVSWTALMAAYAQVGKDLVVFDVFHQMMKAGLQPDLVTFTVLLNACSHSGLVENGRSYFMAMNIDYGVIPTLEHQSCMVDLFCRAGIFEEAIAMIKMSTSDYLPMWIAVLGACQRGENVNLGEVVFERILNLDQRHASAYVSMSNIYVSAPIREPEYNVRSPEMLFL